MERLRATGSSHEAAQEQARSMESVVAHAMTRAGSVEIAALIAEAPARQPLGAYLSLCLSTAASAKERREAVEAAIAGTHNSAAVTGAPVTGRAQRPAKVYHVATEAAWQRIRREGLKPSIGERSSLAAEESPKVFLFASRQDVDDALGNWLGEEFEDYDGELVVIEMETPRGAEPTFPDDEWSWEWSTAEPIDPLTLTVVGRC